MAAGSKPPAKRNGKLPKHLLAAMRRHERILELLQERGTARTGSWKKSSGFRP
jgi:hypothetical protein